MSWCSATPTTGWGRSSRRARDGLVGAFRDGLEFVGVLPDSAEGHLIKRVIGVGGDHVACCDAQGRVTVNDDPARRDGLPLSGGRSLAQPFDGPCRRTSSG